MFTVGDSTFSRDVHMVSKSGELLAEGIDLKDVFQHYVAASVLWTNAPHINPTLHHPLNWAAMSTGNQIEHLFDSTPNNIQVTVRRVYFTVLSFLATAVSAGFYMLKGPDPSAYIVLGVAAHYALLAFITEALPKTSVHLLAAVMLLAELILSVLLGNHLVRQWTAGIYCNAFWNTVH